jgi:hypothetical protein
MLSQHTTKTTDTLECAVLFCNPHIAHDSHRDTSTLEPLREYTTLYDSQRFALLSSSVCRSAFRGCDWVCSDCAFTLCLGRL